MEEGAAGEIDQSFEPEVLAAVSECAAELNEFREREGRTSGTASRGSGPSIQKQAAEMARIRGKRSRCFRNG